MAFEVVERRMAGAKDAIQEVGMFMYVEWAYLERSYWTVTAEN